MTKICKDLISDPASKELFNTKVFDPPEGYSDFIISSKTYEDRIVDLRTIIGSTMRYKHEDTWFNTLKYLKRRKSNFDKYSCDEIIEFYVNPNHKRTQRSYTWHIIFINENGFISEGHHRTTIAKFLSTLGLTDHHISIPKVTYYEVDLESLKKFNQINKKLSLLKKVVCDDFFCSIEVHNDNFKISYTLSIDMSMKNNRIVEQINNEEFNSIEDLKKRLFEYLRAYLNKKEKEEFRKKKEAKRDKLIIIGFIIFIIGYKFLVEV